MGGLTVLSQLRQTLPAEDFLYLGDTARLPYGTKSPSTVRRYAGLAAAKLVERGVKALVIACNTASAFALDELRRQFAPLPVYGVVKPGAAAAIAAADASGVLVLATESTIAGGAYQRELTAAAPTLPVYGRACPMWVALAEQGPAPDELTRAVLGHDLRGFLNCGPMTVLLGCTHFPVFTKQLQQLVAGSRRVTIVDSAATTAAVVAADELERVKSVPRSKQCRRDCWFLATDGARRFRQVGQHFLGEPVERVEIVDL